HHKVALYLIAQNLRRARKKEKTPRDHNAEVLVPIDPRNQSPIRRLVWMKIRVPTPSRPARPQAPQQRNLSHKAFTATQKGKPPVVSDFVSGPRRAGTIFGKRHDPTPRLRPWPTNLSPAYCSGFGTWSLRPRPRSTATARSWNALPPSATRRPSRR